VDGAVFLAVVGFVVATVAGAREPARGLEVLRVPLIALIGLAIATLFLGALAYVLTRGGVRAVGLMFGILAGAAVGGILENRLGFGRGALFGALAGGLLGILAYSWPAPHMSEDGQAAPPGQDGGREGTRQATGRDLDP
jgi:hypothetical protein